MVRGIPSRIARDDDDVTWLERFAGHTLPAELAGASPLHRPALLLTPVVGRHHVDERMGIPEHELNKLAFDFDSLALVVRRGKAVMRAGCHAGGQQRDDENDKKSALFHHRSSPPGYWNIELLKPRHEDFSRESGSDVGVAAPMENQR